MWHSGNGLELDVENEGRVRRNLFPGALLSVSAVKNATRNTVFRTFKFSLIIQNVRNLRQVGRNGQTTLLADLHALDANIPTLDDFTGTEPEPKSFSVELLVKFLAVGLEASAVVDVNLHEDATSNV